MYRPKKKQKNLLLVKRMLSLVLMCILAFHTVVSLYAEEPVYSEDIESLFEDTEAVWKDNDEQMVEETTEASENITEVIEEVEEGETEAEQDETEGFEDSNTPVSDQVILETENDTQDISDDLKELAEDDLDIEEDDPEYLRATGMIDDEFFDENAITLYGISPSASNYVHNSRFSGYTIKTGIDVSRYQGYIDWNRVRAAGVEFAIIRVGYRGYTSGSLVEDEYFLTNIRGAKAAGIKVGVYVFSQAITTEEAVEEANFVLNRIAGYGIDLPVVIDFEYVSNGTGRLYNAYLSVDAATAICKSFCRTVQNAGYTGMVYANKSMLTNQLNASSISAEYKIWLANYTTQTTYAGEYDFWQYTSSGTVDGISGNVDCDFWYIKEEEKPIIGSRTIEDGIYSISTALNSSMVLDVADGSLADCANIQLYKSNGTMSQYFQVIYVGDGYYTFTSLHSGKLLDVLNAVNQDGTNVQQCPYNGNMAQRWVIQEAGNGYYKIISAIGNKHLDVAGGRTANGTNIDIWTGNESMSQLFRFTAYNGQVIEDGIYTISTMLNTNLVLDVANASFDVGANIQLYTKNGTRAQNFLFQYLGNGYYKIICAGTGKVIELYGNNIRQNIYNGTINQKWQVLPTGDGGYRIVSASGNQYMDVTGGIGKVGTNVQVWTENGTLSQKFVLNKYEKQIVSDGVYMIQTCLNGRSVLDVAGGGISNYTNVQLYEMNNTTAQKFRIEYQGNGFYTIKVLHSGKALDVNGGSNADGANVQQYEANRTDAQKWIIQTDGDGTYYIFSAVAGGSLDVAGGRTVNGTNIQIWTPNGTASQKFVLKK